MLWGVRVCFTYERLITWLWMTFLCTLEIELRNFFDLQSPHTSSWLLKFVWKNKPRKSHEGISEIRSLFENFLVYCSTVNGRIVQLFKWVVPSGFWALSLKVKCAEQSTLALKQFSLYSLRIKNITRSPSKLCFLCWAASSPSMSLWTATCCYWLKSQIGFSKKSGKSWRLCVPLLHRGGCCAVNWNAVQPHCTSSVNKISLTAWGQTFNF